jgi:hypothetical protein
VPDDVREIPSPIAVLHTGLVAGAGGDPDIAVEQVMHQLSGAVLPPVPEVKGKPHREWVIQKRSDCAVPERYQVRRLE